MYSKLYIRISKLILKQIKLNVSPKLDDVT